ncbi:MAG: hypothetical protein ACPH9W_15315 [Pseudomonadales bacterium]
MKLRITTLIGALLMLSANIVVASEPLFPPSDLPSFDLTDLEQRATASQQNKAAWNKYQEGMLDAYQKVKDFAEGQSDPELVAVALNRFVETYGKSNNPHSEEDDRMLGFVREALNARAQQSGDAPSTPINR